MKPKRAKNLSSALIETWNGAHAIGTPVDVRRDDGTAFRTVTRSEAWLLGNHTPVIQLQGIAGCYAMERVAAVKLEASAEASP